MGLVFSIALGILLGYFLIILIPIILPFGVVIAALAGLVLLGIICFSLIPVIVNSMSSGVMVVLLLLLFLYPIYNVSKKIIERKKREGEPISFEISKMPQFFWIMFIGLLMVAFLVGLLWKQ